MNNSSFSPEGHPPEAPRLIERLNRQFEIRGPGHLHMAVAQKTVDTKPRATVLFIGIANTKKEAEQIARSTSMIGLQKAFRARYIAVGVEVLSTSRIRKTGNFQLSDAELTSQDCSRRGLKVIKGALTNRIKGLLGISNQENASLVESFNLMGTQIPDTSELPADIFSEDPTLPGD